MVHGWAEAILECGVGGIIISGVGGAGDIFCVVLAGEALLKRDYNRCVLHCGNR